MLKIQTHFRGYHIQASPYSSFYCGAASTLCDSAPAIIGTSKTVHGVHGEVYYITINGFRFLDDTLIKKVRCPCNNDWSFISNLVAGKFLCY